LDQEYDSLDIDLKELTLAVTTEPIKLEGVFLGPFEVRLDLKQLTQAPAYRVVAPAPHPAAGNSGVTHPHVQDEFLCEGEGRAPIRAALDDGRVLDFFTLVCQVLRSYGRGSAYVELEDWEGDPCQDCGASVHAEDRSYCHRCDARLCEECAHDCCGCDHGFCAACLSKCPGCQKRFCDDCLSPCTSCKRVMCSECLEDDLCEECHAKRQHDRDRAAGAEDESQSDPGQPPEGEQGIPALRPSGGVAAPACAAL
jgi:hypothetical protein